MEKNTIILLHGYSVFLPREYKKFIEGDLIWGADENPEEIARWNIEDEQTAIKTLAEYKCSYEHNGSGTYTVNEYALEYCVTDEDGEFIEGSDFTFAVKDEHKEMHQPKFALPKKSEHNSRKIGVTEPCKEK